MNIVEESIIRPTPSDELIEKEERMWRVKLPLEYIEFIKNSNGCRVVENKFISAEKEYVVDRFLAVLENAEEHEEGVYDIDVVLTQIEERLTDNEDLVGVEILPFAQLFAGDYVCLNFKNVRGEQPSVCVWSHEESGDLEPVFYEVADTFEKFMNMLK